MVLAFCFPATGDSMEPMIPDGTTVAVDTNNKRIVDGKLYAIGQAMAGRATSALNSSTGSQVGS
jgi:phage repressor protein C with HTH and peptisase S24 domain